MLHLKSADLTKQKIDILAIPVCEDKDIHEDPIIKSVIETALKLEEFSGKTDESVILYDPPGIMARRVLLAGLGKYEKLDREALRKMAGRTVKNGIAKELAVVWLALPEADRVVLPETVRLLKVSAGMAELALPLKLTVPVPSVKRAAPPLLVQVPATLMVLALASMRAAASLMRKLPARVQVPFTSTVPTLSMVTLLKPLSADTFCVAVPSKMTVELAAVKVPALEAQSPAA